MGHKENLQTYIVWCFLVGWPDRRVSDITCYLCIRHLYDGYWIYMISIYAMEIVLRIKHIYVSILWFLYISEMRLIPRHSIISALPYFGFEDNLLEGNSLPHIHKTIFYKEDDSLLCICICVHLLFHETALGIFNNIIF